MLRPLQKIQLIPIYFSGFLKQKSKKIQQHNKQY